MSPPTQSQVPSNQPHGASVPTANRPLPSHRKLSLRAFTSVVLTLAFGVVAFSGAMLFTAPPGRIANWTGWRLVGLTKQEWIEIHLCFATLFVAAVALHLFFNFRPLLSYLKGRSSARPRLHGSWLLALGLTAGLWACTRAGMPPASWLLTVNARLRHMWADPRTAAPIPHAEELTLKELAERAEVPLDTALERLTQHGLRQVRPETVVADLAAANQLPARRVYEIIRGQVGPGRGGPGRSRTGQAVRTPAAAPADQSPAGHSPAADRGPARGGGGPGGGFGRMTLAEFCQARNLDLKQVQARLEARGIKAQPTQTLREIATANGYDHPRQLIDLIGGR